MMLLTVDIGNTGITFGIFEKNIIKNVFRLLSDKNLERKEYLKAIDSRLSQYKVDSCIIASVVGELNQTIKSVIDEICGIDSIFLTNDLELGLNIISEHPELAGADRVANAVAMKTLYGYPSIAVDFGTATTFDVVGKDGNFIGGIILPGLETQLKSLKDATSKLPQYKPEKIVRVIGRDTKENILSGVVHGQACAIRGLLKECEAELGEQPFVVLTGGYSGLMSEYLKEYKTNSNLTLEGLNIIYEMNF